MNAAELGVSLCVIAALYPYLIYPVFLGIAGYIFGKQPTITAGAELPGITVIVAVHNEEDVVLDTIRRLQSSLAEIPESEILIVSDHSSDGTIALARSINDTRVKVLESKGRRGRAGAHNYAVKQARFPIVMFCDAETVVPSTTMQRFRNEFVSNKVGCVNATIVFSNDRDEDIAKAVGIYWKFEMWIRRAETRLGLYATSSGPCMAVRKELFIDLPASGDVDFTTPLDVIKQGYTCVHLSDSYAYDVLPTSERAEFSARVRMVAKNFGGTITRWGWRRVLSHPLYTWAIYSHKVLRWLVPYFLVGATTFALYLAFKGGVVSTIVLTLILFLAVLCWVLPKLRMLYLLRAFALANTGFAIGVYRALTGAIPSFYVPTRQDDRRG